MRATPPEYEEPPDQVEFSVTVAYCRDCREVFGPDLASSVGEELAFNHSGHEYELIDEWTEVEDVSA